MIKESCANKVLGIGADTGGDGSLRQAFLDLFTTMSDDQEVQGSPNATLILPCYDESCNLQPGDWAPEIHLVIRKVENAEDSTTNLPGEADN